MTTTCGRAVGCVLPLVVLALMATRPVYAQEQQWQFVPMELMGRPAQQLIAEFTAPPAWVDEVEVTYDLNKPWAEARRDIRGMLRLGGEDARRGMKLTWLYYQKGDIGDGSEYALNMYLGGDTLWALANYYHLIRERVVADDRESVPPEWVINYASCCNHFGDYQLALDCLSQANIPSPPAPLQPVNARWAEAMGDTCALIGDTRRAIDSYEFAASVYRTLPQDWIRQHLDGHLGRLQDKIDRVSRETPELGALTDGVYSATVWGFENDVTATVTVAGGAVTQIDIDHQESIPQDAAVVLPEQIIAKQSLDVDAVTGATYTSHAVINAIFRALRQAGLR